MKKSKMQSWENLDINSTPLAGKPTKYFRKPSGAFAAKDVILLDPSKTKIVCCSAIAETSLADGQSISKIFQIYSLSHKTYIWGRKISITAAKVFLVIKTLKTGKTAGCGDSRL